MAAIAYGEDGTLAATQDSGGQWVSPTEAAAAMGMSVRTLCRRIASGELRQQREHGRVLIWLPLAATRTDVAATTDKDAISVSELAATMGQAVSALERTLQEERTARQGERERARQAEQAAAMYQERARGLEEENAKLVAQLALPAPAPTPRPWWQRWRRM